MLCSCTTLHQIEMPRKDNMEVIAGVLFSVCEERVIVNDAERIGRFWSTDAGVYVVVLMTEERQEKKTPM